MWEHFEWQLVFYVSDSKCEIFLSAHLKLKVELLLETFCRIHHTSVCVCVCRLIQYTVTHLTMQRNNKNLTLQTSIFGNLIDLIHIEANFELK